MNTTNTKLHARIDHIVGTMDAPDAYRKLCRMAATASRKGRVRRMWTITIAAERLAELFTV